MFKFNSVYFIISFFIGIFIVYVATPYPEVIFTFPTPDNVDSIVYNSNGGTCFKYKAKEVQCDANSKKTPIYKNKKSFNL